MGGLGRLAGVWLGALIVSFSGVAARAQTLPQSQPDILWIVTDDQRPDSVAAFNRAMTGRAESRLGPVESPNLDRLARQGVLFVNAFNQAPTCGPSRTSMLTGRYPFRNGKYGWENTHQTADFVRPAFSQAVRRAGYGTAVIGKRHYSIAPKDKSEPIYDLELDFARDMQRNGIGDFTSEGSYGLADSVLLRRAGTETVFYPDGRTKTYQISWADRELSAAEEATKAAVEKEFDILRARTQIHTSLILGGVNPMPAGRTIDGRILEEFQNYLANANRDYKSTWGATLQGADRTKPLFVNLGFHFPHTPVLPPKSFRDRFKSKHYRLPEFDTDELSALPPQLVETYNEAKSDRLTDSEKLQAVRDYYAFTAYGDTLIGKAVDSFVEYSKSNGREYMVVITIGDHGWQLGEQGIMGKFGPWDQSIHGAAIVISSNKTAFPAGKVFREFVEYVDFAPTIMAAAGVDVGKPEFAYLDGFDLARALVDPKLKRDYILGEMNLVNGHRAYMRTKDFAFSMRTRDFRTEGRSPNLNRDVTWALDVAPKKADLALYDLRVDPGERRNLATTLDYDDLAQWFREKLGNIVLGDGRVEADWGRENAYNLSNFAGGADDKRIAIPPALLPNPPRVTRPGPNR
ncbi:sulfatase-like hydrolase/transferase [Sphingomonas sp.]|uniref:sulfatase-like hydrolase/transferase n=1 Tax=Sphingomonas sp. TaxID=28214 RepID=UPI003BA9AE55